VAYLKVLMYRAGKNEEKQDNPQSGKLAIRPKFEPSAQYRSRVLPLHRSVLHYSLKVPHRAAVFYVWETTQPD